MAKGYPDFYGFPIFPYYGDVSEEYDAAVVVLAGAFTELFSVTGKLRVHGGFMYISSNSSMEDDFFTVEIDGVAFYNFYVSEGIALHGAGFNYPIVPTYIRSDYGLAYYTFQTDWLAKDTFKISYDNNHANQIVANIRFNYDLLQ